MFDRYVGRECKQTAMALVDDPQIKYASFHNELPLFLHAYIWPFAVAWPVFAGIYLSSTSYEKYVGGSEWTFVWTGTIITIQSLVWLSTHWNVNIKSFFTSTSARSVQYAKRSTAEQMSRSFSRREGFYTMKRRNTLPL